MGKKSKIIMGLATAAMIPAILTGCGHKEHDPKDEWKTDATHHWHECEESKCDEKLDKAEHEAATVYSHNETHHWKECTECEYDLSLEQHTFDKEVVESKYLKTEATATTKAVYYKSCICGEKGTETFESGLKIGTISNLAISNKTYDGTAVSAPTYDKNTDGTVTVEYKLKTAADTTYTTVAPINAGEYTARVSIAETANHTSVSETKDFTISKYVISGLEKEFTYDGQSIHIVNLPKALNLPDDNVNMVMTFDSANAGASVSEVKVLVNGNESSNYDVVDCEASITRATPSLDNVAMSSAMITYGDEYNVQCQSIDHFYESTYNGFIAEEYFVNSVWTTEKPTNAGTYKARLRVLNTTNYNEVIGEEVEFEIQPFVISGFTKDVEYNGTEYQFINLEDYGYESGLRLDITFQNKNVGAERTAVVVSIDGTPTDNYELDDASFTVNVVAKKINIEWQSNAEPLYFEGEPVKVSYEFVDKCEGDDLSANIILFEGNNATYDSTFKMAATLTGADADNYELQNEYSGVYTIVDLDAITVGDSFDVSESGTKALFKTNLTANKYYRFFNEGGNSYAQGTLTTISVFKKSNNTLVATRIFDSTGTDEVFNHTYFTVDATGEYYLVATLNIESEDIVFEFEEDEHSELDDYGFCTVCGEYKGQTYESEQVISQTVAGGQKYFFRIAVAEGTDIEYGIITDGSLSASALKVYYVSNADPRTMSVANVDDLILVEDDNLNPGALNNTQTNPLINSIDGYFYFVLEGPINTQFKIRVVDFSS